jgi:hypothetical protein
MLTTTLVAWWGATLSTVVFIWDIIKWRKAGPKLRFSVRTGMRTLNVSAFDGRTLISLEATNFGDRPTTITNICYVYFPNRWALLRNRAPGGWVANQPSPAQPLPFELKPGTVWMGFTDQTPDFEEKARAGYLMCDLYHSHTPKPIRRRVFLRTKRTADAA